MARSRRLMACPIRSTRRRRCAGSSRCSTTCRRSNRTSARRAISSSPRFGRMVGVGTPSYDLWRCADGSTFTEYANLYVLPPLMAAGERLHHQPYIDAANEGSGLLQTAAGPRRVQVGAGHAVAHFRLHDGGSHRAWRRGSCTTRPRSRRAPSRRQTVPSRPILALAGSVPQGWRNSRLPGTGLAIVAPPTRP